MINLFLFVSENNVFGFYECFQFNTSNLWCLWLQVQRSSGFSFNHKNRSCGCFSELFRSLATTSENAFFPRALFNGTVLSTGTNVRMTLDLYGIHTEMSLIWYFCRTHGTFFALSRWLGIPEIFWYVTAQKLGMWISVIVFHSELRSNRKRSTCIGLDSH